jgi:hypothetical protein
MRDHAKIVGRVIPENPSHPRVTDAHCKATPYESWERASVIIKKYIPLVRIGSVALICGAFARVASAAIALLMVGAIAMVHAHFGFYMNWFGQQKGEGFEYHLLAIGLAVAVLLRGAGSFSVDGLLSKRMAQG